jgi:hypothetical protein
VAYSIYFYLRPGVLGSEEFKTCPALQEFFSESFRRRPLDSGIDAGLLFGYIKPREDSRREVQLFSELEAVKPWLTELAHDEWVSEPTLWSKLLDSGHKDLLRFVAREEIPAELPASDAAVLRGGND